MGVQLSLKAALPLAERIATASDRYSKTGHWVIETIFITNCGCIDNWKILHKPSTFHLSTAICIGSTSGAPHHTLMKPICAMACYQLGFKSLFTEVMAFYDIQLRHSCPLQFYLLFSVNFVCLYQWLEKMIFPTASQILTIWPFSLTVIGRDFGTDKQLHPWYSGGCN